MRHMINAKASHHKWMSHITHMKESCHACEWAKSHLLTEAQFLATHDRGVNEVHPQRVSAVRIDNNFGIGVVFEALAHLFAVFCQLCALTHSYVWHDYLIRVTWLPHMCDMTTSFRPIHMCDMTTSYMCHDWLINVKRLLMFLPSSACSLVACEWVMSHVWMSHGTCMR